jgi:glucose-6-phosphate isomerase
MTTAPSLTATPEWRATAEHADRLRHVTIRTLFASDPQRVERFAAEGASTFLDYSKHRLDAEAMGALIRLAEAAGVAERRERMFSGERINLTEGRAVLHTALRAPRG